MIGTLEQAIERIEVYADVKQRAPGLNIEAIWMAAPVPIERPKIIMSYSLIPVSCNMNL